VNQFLRFIEGLIIIALLGIFGYAGMSLLKLNNVSKNNWSLPTLTPTALIRALILPGGNTSPSSYIENQASSNQIPLNIKPFVKSDLNIQYQTPAPQNGVRIQIPALNIDAPIVRGDGPEQLKKGVGQHIGTANPGEIGNMVLSGHNDTFGEVFRYLDQMKAGDKIIIYTFTRSYTYIVEGWSLVNPDQVDVMDPTPYESVTLISCYPYLIDTQRIIVTARLQVE
jgi:sortase A